jgi:DNA-binding response OmpR family regulator
MRLALWSRAMFGEAWRILILREYEKLGHHVVCRVREKLGRAADCIQTVRGIGYRLDVRIS